MKEINRLLILVALLVPATLLFSAMDCNCKLDCEDTHIGMAELQFVDSSFFPLQPNDEIDFANDKGFEGKFIASNITDTILQRANEITASRCWYSCFEYYSYHERSINETLQDVDLNITYTHGKMVKYQERVGNLDTVPDEFRVQIGSLSCAFLIDPFPQELVLTPEQPDVAAEMLDTFSWYGQTYRQVLHFYAPGANPGVVEIAGGYYTLKDGVIGFYLSNNEEWFIK